MTPLLSIGADAKTSKGAKLGWRTAILYLQPSKNLCPSMGACAKPCLVSSGRMPMAGPVRARANRTERFNSDRAGFVDALREELRAFVESCGRAGVRPAVRLNGTSDVAWERERGTDGRTVFEDDAAAYVRFYDYTKRPDRMMAFLFGELPEGYYLTYSHGGNVASAAVIPAILAKGGNVAVPFATKRGKPLPRAYLGRPVSDGDRHDLRFLDRRGGRIVGLRAKGNARRPEHQHTGFVIPVK